MRQCVLYYKRYKMENYAAVLRGPNNVNIEKWPVPKISDYDVLIRVESVGICGSDVKLYSSGKCGADILSYESPPVVLGHEGAGVVVQVGTKVSNLKVGDRVAIEPTQPCRACEFCKQGRYNVCEAPGYCSSAGTEGNLCRYYKHVADFCHKIPDNLSMDEAAAVQPLAIAIHACNRAGIKLGTNLLILGSGPIGLLSALSAKAMGATKIIMTDVVESRLETAKSLVADCTLLIKKEFSDKDVESKILELLGDRPNVTIDACGFASAQRIAMNITKTGGVVLVVGIGGDSVEVPLSPALLREVDIRGSFRINNTYPNALAAASSCIDLIPFITHHFPLEKTRQALDLAKSGNSMKIIIHPQQ